MRSVIKQANKTKIKFSIRLIFQPISKSVKRFMFTNVCGIIINLTHKSLPQGRNICEDQVQLLKHIAKVGTQTGFVPSWKMFEWAHSFSFQQMRALLIGYVMLFSAESNHPHFSRVPNIRRNLHLSQLFEINSCKNSSLYTSDLTSSSKRTIAIFLP